MLKIVVDSHGANTPKKNFLKDFNIAFANSDDATILASISKNIKREMLAANLVIEGKDEFAKILEKTKQTKTEALVIKNIIVQDHHASVSGEMLMVNGKRYAFCDVYELAKTEKSLIKTMTSYVMRIKSD